MASAGDDKKISLWHKNGNSMGTIPVAGTDSGDSIEVIFAFGVAIVLHKTMNIVQKVKVSSDVYYR